MMVDIGMVTAAEEEGPRIKRLFARQSACYIPLLPRYSLLRLSRPPFTFPSLSFSFF